MSDFVDHYSVLDVRPSASGSELYSAYCQAVRQWLKDDPTFNHENLNRIQESYRFLQNPGKRKTFHEERLQKIVKDFKSNNNYVPQLEENNQEKPAEILQDARPQERDKFLQEFLPESVKNESKSQCKEELHQDCIYEKVTPEDHDLKTPNEDSELYEKPYEEALHEFYDDLHQGISNQSQDYTEESRMQYNGYLQNQYPPQYLEDHLENSTQYYDYHQENQPQYYEYIQQDRQPLIYGYLQENQVLYYGFAYETQSHCGY